jgi:hypothetical protein
MIEEWIELMRGAVRRRIETLRPSKVVVSLSAGHDSRGLLGLAVDAVGAESVETFTYHHGEVIGDMDRDLAAELARIAGVRHRVIDAYEGDLPQLIRYNAMSGAGVAHFCDEGDVWRGIQKRYESSGAVLFVGDRQSMHFSLGRPPNGEDALVVCSVNPPWVIEWFLDSLEPSVAEAIVLAWGSQFEALANALDRSSEWETRLHEAYLQQRIPYTLNLWRELFCSQAIPAVSPFLAADVMDFVLGLPRHLNDEDAGMLHSAAIWKAFPKLGEVAVSRGGWNAPNWGDEVRRHATQIREGLHSETSPLDALVPIETVLGLLNQVEESRGSLADAKRGLRWAARKWVKRTPLLQEAARQWKMKRWASGKSVNKDQLLRRLLCLRSAVAQRQYVGGGGEDGWQTI